MYKEKRVSVIIAAAGSGKRFGSSTPKQFLSLGNETVISKAIRAFNEHELVDEIVIVTSEGFIDELKGLEFSKIREVVLGGKERQDSINNALHCINSGLVLVHDAARPFVTDEVITRVIEEAYVSKAVVPCVPPKDTIRDEEGTLDRSKLKVVQTPQGFDAEILKKAYEKAFLDGFYGTDDASLVERIGEKVTTVMGDYENIKITTPSDLPKNSPIPMIRVGTGFDVHKLVEDRKCILGGVDIPYEKGLLGHSDADVLIHALMDALLGAAALGDIGRHFPDNDDSYKGISSRELLKRVKALLDENGFEILNVDCTVICQKPKIAPYIDMMIKNISEDLKLDVSNINVKGTTTEKLGFTGRGEGIASEAIATIYMKK